MHFLPHHRFEYETPPSFFRGLFLSIILFAVVLGMFFAGVGTIAGRTSSEESKTLHEAVSRGVTRCYAIEGCYPESIDYLIANYGLMFDEDRFYIDYRPLGANIMPDITIIDKEEAK